MGFKPGKDAWLKMDGVNAAGTVLTSYFDTFSWPQSVETVDVSAFGTAAKASIPTLTDGDTLAVGGPLDAAIFTHMTALKAAHAAGSSTSTMIFAPMGSVSGYPSITAEVWVTGFNPSSAVGGRAEWAGSLQVTGAVTNTTF